MSEKETKDIKAKIDIKIILIIVLLIVIFAMQFNQNRKIEKLFDNSNSENYSSEDYDRRPRNEFVKKIKREFLDNLDREMREMHLIRDRIQDEMGEYFDGKDVSLDEDIDDNEPNNFENSQNINIDLRTEEKYDKNKKNYIVDIYLSNDFKASDVVVSISNNMLYIKILKNGLISNNKEKTESSFSSLKVITLPNTKAETKDIKKIFKDGKLTITVPII